MDAFKSAAGSLKSINNFSRHLEERECRRALLFELNLLLENKECRQVLRFELNLLLDVVKGIGDKEVRESTAETAINLSLRKCHEDMLMIGQAHTRTNVTLDENQKTAFASCFPRFAKALLEFHTKSKAEPNNQNIKTKLEYPSEDKYYRFIEEGINDDQGWSVLICAKKDGKRKKDSIPIRLVKLDKSEVQEARPETLSSSYSHDEQPSPERPQPHPDWQVRTEEPRKPNGGNPASVNRAPANLNSIEPKLLKRITATETRPAKTEPVPVPEPEPSDVVKNLLDTQDGKLSQIMGSELVSAIAFYGNSKGLLDVEQLIDVHIMTCAGMLDGEEKHVFESIFPPLVKARIAAGKQLQENPSAPDIQVLLEGDFGGQFSLLVEKKYGDQFFFSRAKREGNKTNITGVREELMELGMPDQYELSAPPSGSLQALPAVSQGRTFQTPQIKKETPHLSSFPPSRSVPPPPLKTPHFPQLSIPTFPSAQLLQVPGVTGSAQSSLGNQVKPRKPTGL